MTINEHPQVSSAVRYIGVYPTHYKGSLIDGRFFDFVYRGGEAVVSIRDANQDGYDRNAVVMDVTTTDHDLFDSDEQRDSVFAELLERRLSAEGVSR